MKTICTSTQNDLSSTFPIDKVRFLTNLAIAQAMRSPLPKRVKNQSIDRSQLPHVFAETDRVQIRNQFLSFLRELWVQIIPSESVLVQKILRIVGENDLSKAHARELILDSFSRSVYSVIFCDWLQAKSIIMENNIKEKVTTFTIDEQGNRVNIVNTSFYESLPNAKGKLFYVVVIRLFPITKI